MCRETHIQFSKFSLFVTVNIFFFLGVGGMGRVLENIKVNEDNSIQKVRNRGRGGNPKPKKKIKC